MARIGVLAAKSLQGGRFQRRQLGWDSSACGCRRASGWGPTLGVRILVIVLSSSMTRDSERGITRPSTDHPARRGPPATVSLQNFQHARVRLHSGSVMPRDAASRDVPHEYEHPFAYAPILVPPTNTRSHPRLPNVM